MFSRFKFFQIGVPVVVRGKCFGTSSNVRAQNASNEKIAEETNSANERINSATNATNTAIQRETNAANIQMNTENNALQQKLQEDMNAFNYRMWQENNEYNSPANQLARAQAAGINPNSALGTAVAASPVQQVSLPQTQAGHSDASFAQPYQAIGYHAEAGRDPLEQIMDFAKTINSSAQTMGQVLANENQAYVNKFAPAMLSADLQGKNIANDLGKSNIKNVNQSTILMQRQAEGISQQINESKQKVLNMQMEWNNLSEDNYRKQIDNSFAYVMNQANLDNICADTKMKQAEVRYIGVKMKCDSMLAYSQANHLNWQSEVLKLEKQGRDEYLKNGGTLSQIRQMNAATGLYTSQTTGQDLTNDITREMGEYQVREAAAHAESAEYQNSTFVRALDACDKIGGTIQKVGTGVGSVVNAFKPGVTFNSNNGYVSTPTGRNPYE